MSKTCAERAPGTAAAKGNGRGTNRKLGHVRVSRRRIDSIQPSPENAKLYRPPSPTDPEMIELAKSIRKYGVKVPLVLTKDGFILSGHRRHMAAEMAGLKSVPCRVLSISRNGKRAGLAQTLAKFSGRLTRR